MIDRDKFAADVYLRLLAANPHKEEGWLRAEAVRQADEFIAHLESSKDKPPLQKRKRKEVVTA